MTTLIFVFGFLALILGLITAFLVFLVIQLPAMRDCWKRQLSYHQSEVKRQFDLYGASIERHQADLAKLRSRQNSSKEPRAEPVA